MGRRSFEWSRDTIGVERLRPVLRFRPKNSRGARIGDDDDRCAVDQAFAAFARVIVRRRARLPRAGCRVVEEVGERVRVYHLVSMPHHPISPAAPRDRVPIFSSRAMMNEDINRIGVTIGTSDENLHYLHAIEKRKP